MHCADCQTLDGHLKLALDFQCSSRSGTRYQFKNKSSFCFSFLDESSCFISVQKLSDVLRTRTGTLVKESSWWTINRLIERSWEKLCPTWGRNWSGILMPRSWRLRHRTDRFTARLTRLNRGFVRKWGRLVKIQWVQLKTGNGHFLGIL